VFENVRALVVEDDAHSLIAITTILKELGIEYKRNTTGADVIKQVEAMRSPPDFIFLDLDLPKGDAFHICREIHANPRLARVRVIAIADHASKELLKKVKSGEFAGFVTKPLPRKGFGELLQRLQSGEHVYVAVS
jgi:two-component system, sensor histidine kinase and response regulator